MQLRFAKTRLIVAVLALFAWIGYIAYQALTYGRFPVVSHAQLLISTLDVIAEVDAGPGGQPEPTVHVVEVHWPPGKRDIAGKNLSVVNLSAANGFQGPGHYILPLVGGEHGNYTVAGLPRSPGFDRANALFIYPDLPITRKQLDAAPKPPVGS
jgi:hypothetical protein